MGMGIFLRVISASGEALGVKVRRIRMVSSNGSFGVLPGHAPMLAEILPGEILYDDDSGRHKYITRGGIAEISPLSVTVIE